MNQHRAISEETVAGRLASFAATAAPPPAAVAVSRRLLLDICGLAFAARHEPYTSAALASAAGTGPCTAIGHARGLNLYDAALVNGTAAHGEDYDDTFEGGPVHAGVVVVPAALALAQHRGLDGTAVMRAIAIGAELMSRLSLVAPQAIHKAGFHPTAVIGAMAAAASAGAAIGLDRVRLAHALGIAGSLASGIIEYLADGSWTKRLHPGAAAQAGLRAALLAEGGFVGPATVFEGDHGFFRAFAPSKTANFAPLLDGLGADWIMPTIAFKPYACGTMTQPFIDCAIALARQGVRAEEIVSLTCKAGEGTVHRLWEPLAAKQAVPNGYAGKFSTPFCMAVGFLDGAAGLVQFTDAQTRREDVRALAAKISYEIDPADEYPRNFTGHLRATLTDGSVREIRQPHMRGGAREPLSDAELVAKFNANVAFGGGDAAAAAALHAAIDAIAGGGKVALGESA
ncbi:MmgE/PrpD family protein [Ancylobacter vacuolatus]|uniref:2-methylcitrate dehydratase PrpD n=1 Tax=Ancylobacter vacuolatus TaxID=223389 RepID=A0ABU0DE37_9HYPH|nr:MmgE/PrpD family protein [Ancylobacter vacuolatus]MDQ0346659.1 2-methylcitrate dehydratase PrpD [Ancylobacter vacuolatus]